ncbi:unnamed protein product (mitochondrion) [Plasmodiophora brassicae]|uniref:Uncharacterized protein n=1 Tax=Plasmodiophora brassicae TaxID=37360 RepID=A0A3P3YFY7_PLABS|nr:unnamed protein product [Plasmodiophora brassicae]
MMAKWKREQEQRDDRNEWGRTQMKKHKSFIGELKQDGVPAPVQIRRPITWIPGHVVDERHDTKAIPANNVAFIGELKQVTQKMMGDYAAEGRDTLPIASALSKNASL